MRYETIAAIGGIVILESIALLKGINGVLLSTSIGILAGLGGYLISKIKNGEEENNC